MSEKTILIVDDDADVRLGLHVRLKANLYDVIFAADGMASVAQAREHMPDLIILDLGLPAGNSFSVMERLKANDSQSLIPVIVVSANDVTANMDRALKAGARAFLQTRWIMLASCRRFAESWANGTTHPTESLRAICYRSKPAQLERLESLVKSINHFWRTKVNLLRRKQSG